MKHGAAKNANEHPRIRVQAMAYRRVFSVAQLAYLAGLIDGDGYIGVRRRERAATRGDRARYAGFCTRTTIGGETNHLSLLRCEFGGVGTLHIRKRKHQRHLAEWCIADGKATALLVVILPYLRLKKRQAELVISMPRARSRWGATPAMRRRQEKIRIEVQKLNRLGRGKKK